MGFTDINIELPKGGTRESVLYDLLVQDCRSLRLLWYRIFAIGTFVSANRRSRQLHDFLKESVALPKIWNAFDSDVYRESVDVAFEAIVGRDVSDEKASQENAIFCVVSFTILEKPLFDFRE